MKTVPVRCNNTNTYFFHKLIIMRLGNRFKLRVPYALIASVSRKSHIGDRDKSHKKYAEKNNYESESSKLLVSQPPVRCSKNNPPFAVYCSCTWLGCLRRKHTRLAGSQRKAFVPRSLGVTGAPEELVLNTVLPPNLLSCSLSQFRGLSWWACLPSLCLPRCIRDTQEADSTITAVRPAHAVLLGPERLVLAGSHSRRNFR